MRVRREPGGTAVITMTGEVDIAAVAGLRDRLFTLADTSRSVIVDRPRARVACAHRAPFLPSRTSRRRPVARYRRLGKQGVEALQVVRALTRPGYGWQNHPAVRMWRGYEETPGAYGIAGRLRHRRVPRMAAAGSRRLLRGQDHE